MSRRAFRGRSGGAQSGFAAGSLVLVLAALALPAFFQRFFRDTNADAAARRGVAEFSRKQYAPAIADFARAGALRPSPASDFNLGTAQIAAGKREDGSTTIAKAMADPVLRADSYYNRGNSALAANANEYAIQDYIAALKIRPHDMQAKRNLEIALAKKKKQDKQQSGQGAQQASSGGGGTKGQQDQPSKPGPPTPRPGVGQDQKTGLRESQRNQVAESILRGIQQQESEALRDMKRSRAQGQKVGW